MGHTVQTSGGSWDPVWAALEVFMRAPDYYDAQRIFHGRSGRFPELAWCNIDAFWPLILITAYKEPPPEFLAEMATRLECAMSQTRVDDSPVRLAVQRRDLAAVPTEFYRMEPLTHAIARRGRQRFEIAFDRQNIGFFTDIEPARQWLEREAKGRRVLNLFAFTCVFSVVALQAGATDVVNVDLSRSALSRGRRNHEHNGLQAASASFDALDILKSWGRIKKRGPFDIILIDPPSFQRGSFIASRDYAKIIRRIPELAAPDARILACLNAPEIPEKFLREEFNRHCPDASFMESLQQRPVFHVPGEEQPLKMLVYKWSAAGQAKASTSTRRKISEEIEKGGGA